MTHCVRWGPWPSGKGQVWESDPKHNAAKPSVLCCHLANTNEEWGRWKCETGKCGTGIIRNRKRMERHVWHNL